MHLSQVSSVPVISHKMSLTVRRMSVEILGDDDLYVQAEGRLQKNISISWLIHLFSSFFFLHCSSCCSSFEKRKFFCNFVTASQWRKQLLNNKISPKNIFEPFFQGQLNMTCIVNNIAADHHQIVWTHRSRVRLSYKWDWNIVWWILSPMIYCLNVL